MDNRHAWITPDEIPDAVSCRVLSIPDDPILYANVVGALLPLTQAQNWEQVGDVTPEEAAARMTEMFDEFVQGECVIPRVAFLWEQQNQNVAAGGFTAGAWRVRTINQLFDDPDPIGITLSSNRFTVPAGKYRIHARAPANAVNGNRLALWSQTDGFYWATGVTGYALSSVLSNFWTELENVSTFTDSKALELHHYCTTTRATDGFGRAANIPSTVEVYAVITITKLD